MKSLSLPRIVLTAALVCAACALPAPASAGRAKLVHTGVADRDASGVQVISPGHAHFAPRLISTGYVRVHSGGTGNYLSPANAKDAARLSRHYGGVYVFAPRPPVASRQ